MKTTALATLALLLLFTACTSPNANDEAAQREPMAFEANTLPRQVAAAYGFPNIYTVDTVSFTFNVERGGNSTKRTHAYLPQENIAIYNGRFVVDLANYKSDTTDLRPAQAFVNDSYWFMFPFQLVWDEGNYTYTDSVKTAPISGRELRQLSIVYNDTDGFTPGDAYDLYLDDKFNVVEWRFRKGNSYDLSRSMATTWERPIESHGMTFSTMHQDSSEYLKIFFTEVEVR